MRQHQLADGWYAAYCKPCDCYTYLMARSRGKNKARRRKGVLMAIRCCRCKKARAVLPNTLK